MLAIDPDQRFDWIGLNEKLKLVPYNFWPFFLNIFLYSELKGKRISVQNLKKRNSN